MEVKTPEKIAEEINGRFAEFKSALDKSATQDEVKALEADYKEFRSQNEDRIAEFESKATDLENRLKEQIDRMSKIAQSSHPLTKHLTSVLLEEFKSDKWQRFLNNRGEGPSPKMQINDAIFKGFQSKALTWGASGAEKINDIVHNYMPFDVPVVNFEEPLDMRSILPIGTIDKGSLDFPREKTYTDGMDVQPETGESDKSDATYEMVTVNARRIATNMDVSRRALKSATWLANHVANRFRVKWVKKLNTEVLVGDGTGDHFDGLHNQASAWTAPAGMQGKIATGESTLIDAVIAMRTGFYLTAKRYPNALFVSPTTHWLLSSAKATTREFVNPNVFVPTSELAGAERIAGMLVYPSMDIPDNTCLMGLISLETVELLNFDGIILDSTEFHDKNFTSSLITFRLESEMLLPVYHKECFLKADLSAVQTAITA